MIQTENRNQVPWGLFLLALLAVGGCEALTTPEGVGGPSSQLTLAQEALVLGFAPGDSAHSVTEDLVLASSVGKVPVEWNTSLATVVSPTGSVSRPAAETTVKLTATLADQSHSLARDFNVVVRSKDWTPTPAPAPGSSDIEVKFALSTASSPALTQISSGALMAEGGVTFRAEVTPVDPGRQIQSMTVSLDQVSWGGQLYPLNFSTGSSTRSFSASPVSFPLSDIPLLLGKAVATQNGYGVS